MLALLRSFSWRKNSLIRATTFCLSLAFIPPIGASAQEPSAILRCIDSSFVNGHIHLTHVTEGTGDVISRDEWVIRCEGPVALRAWDQFFLFRKDEPVPEVHPNGARALVLATGHGSRCFKLITNADGSPGNKAVCDISLDLIPSIQGSGLLRP